MVHYLSKTKCSTETQFFALKILSLDATQSNKSGEMLELEALQKLEAQYRNLSRFLPAFYDTFEIPGSLADPHTCIVLNLLGPDVATFRRKSPNKALPHYTVRIIMREVLQALAHLHGIGIIHTGLCESYDNKSITLMASRRQTGQHAF